jgi:2'-5' RNA ligase
MTTVRAKRLGWNETTNITATDELDPYDYTDAVVEGDLQKIKVDSGVLHYTNYVVAGQPVDPDTIEEIDDQGDASTAAVVRSNVDSGFTSGMIALVPTAEDAARLALDEDNGEPANELHLTLCFLGDAADYPQEQRDALVTSIEDLVETSQLGPVQGNAFGVNYWNPASDDPAWVLAVGSTPDNGLTEVYGLAYEAIYNTSLSVPDQHKPWVPHVTIAYGIEPILEEMEARLGPITFDRIRVAFGDEYHDVVLTDERATLTES